MFRIPRLQPFNVSSSFVCGNWGLGECQSEGRKSRPSRPTPLRPSGPPAPPTPARSVRDRAVALSAKFVKTAKHARFACTLTRSRTRVRACAVAAQSHPSAGEDSPAAGLSWRHMGLTSSLANIGPTAGSGSVVVRCKTRKTPPQLRFITRHLLSSALARIGTCTPVHSHTPGRACRVLHADAVRSPKDRQGMRGQHPRPARHWVQCLATMGGSDWSTRPTTIIRLSLNSPEPTWVALGHSRSIDPIGMLPASASGASGESSAVAGEGTETTPYSTLGPFCGLSYPHAACARSMVHISYAFPDIMCYMRRKHDMHDYPGKWVMRSVPVGRASTMRCTG